MFGHSWTRGATAALSLMLALPAAARSAVMTTVPASANTPAVAVYVAIPNDAKQHPAVLLLHGCGGFSGFEAVAADRLAARGYVGVALDALGPKQPHGACEAGPAGSHAEAVAALATLRWLRTQAYVDPDRLALIGFSMGAKAVLDIIDPIGTTLPPPPGLRVAIAYYPACAGHDGSITIPLAIFDGDADNVTPAAPCAALVKAATAAGKSATITTYAGATHGFDVPGPERTFYGEPIRFDPIAAADSVRQAAALLARYLGEQAASPSGR